MISNKLVIGGHLSIRGGYRKAAVTAWESGAHAFQYFPKNPRSLQIKAFDARDALRCKQFCQEHGIYSIAHTPYPSNLAIGQSEQPERYRTTVLSLQNDLEIAEACGSLGIVVHFGTNKASNPLQGYKNIIQCINDVLVGWKGSAKLLLENQAGDHGEMGMTMEEMVQIRHMSADSNSIGFCLDTCHAFAAGIWAGEKDDVFIQKGYELGYWEHVLAIHLNDSKYPFHSRKDRHARIGEGYIGKEGFRSLLTIQHIREKVLILESETGDDGTYMEDMERATQWIKA